MLINQLIIHILPLPAHYSCNLDFSIVLRTFSMLWRCCWTPADDCARGSRRCLLVHFQRVSQLLQQIQPFLTAACKFGRLNRNIFENVLALSSPLPCPSTTFFQSRSSRAASPIVPSGRHTCSSDAWLL